MADDENDKKPVRLLIADKDGRFGAQLKAAHKAAKEANPDGFTPRPIVTDTMRESQSYLSNRDYSYAGVFVNPGIGAPQWIAVVKAVHQFRAGTPVYVIYDEEGAPKVTKKDVAPLGVQGFLKKPLDYAQLVKLVNAEEEASQELPPEQAVAAPTKKGPPPQNPEDFVAAELKNINGAAKSLFDLYVKLSNGKFVKVLNEGESLSKDRIESYKAKGVTDLFIPKTSQEQFMAFCDSLTASLVNDASVSLEVKTSQVFNQGASVTSFLQNSGFSEKSLESARQYVENTTSVVQQMGANNDMVKAILSDALAMEHGVAIATLASLLIKHIGGSNAALFSAVGITCFLHDASLLGCSDAIRQEDESKMTEEEKKIFYAHPLDSSKLAKKVKGAPPAVEQAILEHHLRLNKKGFPTDKLVTTPNRMAELIGVCEEFIQLLKKAEIDKSINPKTVMESRIGGEFSEPIVKAFIKAFAEK
jgi:HD-GYP domain-containing protein (c-di-GMP phosphodiesterase class II)